MANNVERTNVSLPIECYADLRVLAARNKSSISEEIYKLWEIKIKGTLNDIFYSGHIDWEQAGKLTPVQFEKFLDAEMTTLYNDIYDKWKEQQLLLNGKTMEKLYGKRS